MTRVLSIMLAAFLSILLVACGGSSESPRPTPTPALNPSTPTPEPVSGTPAPAPTTLRVAYINLGSPITVDENDTVAEETFMERLEMVAEELAEFEPDVVALSDATWMKDLGPSAWEVLASALRLEPAYQRANPWFRDQDREASNATRDLIGFEEGEAILSRYPILQTRRLALNPRTSETEGRIALHAVINVEPYGEVSVYVSRLSGTLATREAQAADLHTQIESTREERPTIVFADFGLTEESEAVATFRASFADLSSAAGDASTFGTCCRAGMLFNIPEDPPDVEGDPESPFPASPPAEGDGAENDEPAQPETPGEVAELRTSYIFASSWPAMNFRTFGELPKERADGSRLYASDQNGILAVVSLSDGWPGND